MLEKILLALSLTIILAWSALSLRRHFRLTAAPARGALPDSFGPEVRLRDIYRLAVTLEEEARDFYLRMARLVKNPETKKLCYMLAQEETGHAKVLNSSMAAWRPLPPNVKTWPELLEKVKRSGLFENPPGEGASEEELAGFAIRQEIKSAELYSTFEKAFPDAWKAGKLRKLIAEERRHEALLRAEYPAVKA